MFYMCSIKIMDLNLTQKNYLHDSNSKFLKTFSYILKILLYMAFTYSVLNFGVYM